MPRKAGAGRIKIADYIPFHEHDNEAELMKLPLAFRRVEKDDDGIE